MRAVRLCIRGRVQGVGYREWTRRTAVEYGLTGWVRNRRDGSVEAVVCGSAADVERMVERCQVGPPMADVTALDSADDPADQPSGFTILPTE